MTCTLLIVFCRTCNRPRGRWLRIPVHGLALDELDRSNRQRRRFHGHSLDPRNIRASYPSLARRKEEEGNGRREILESIR
jgi:hypothetical protein